MANSIYPGKTYFNIFFQSRFAFLKIEKPVKIIILKNIIR